jgi:hypothetical protein
VQSPALALVQGLGLVQALVQAWAQGQVQPLVQVLA